MGLGKWETAHFREKEKTYGKRALIVGLVNSIAFFSGHGRTLDDV